MYYYSGQVEARKLETTLTIDTRTIDTRYDPKNERGTLDFI